MTDLGDIIAEAITPLIDAIVEHDRRLGATDWRGKVTDVDPAKKLARIELGKNSDGEVVKSPWQPYSQVAGALKIHSAPSVGQVMSIQSSTGDLEQGALVPFHWSDDNPSPSESGDEHVLTLGDVRVTLTGGGIFFTVGGVTYEFTGGGFVQTGGKQEHDGKNVGSDHKHIEVTPGGGISGVPTSA